MRPKRPKPASAPAPASSIGNARGQIVTAFVTEIYRVGLPLIEPQNESLAAIAYSMAEEDEAGQAWCAAHAYPGYTSYGSVNDLAWRYPPISALNDELTREAHAFAGLLEFDLRGRALRLDSLWVNILGPGGGHSGHIHPHSILSGTYYVSTPPKAGALRLEDPRLPLMMAAPARLPKAQAQRQSFFYLQPHAGEAIFWESWLRHEVPLNECQEDRISISFNFSWE